MKIIGRTEKGKRICIFDGIDSFFWVLLDKKLSNEKIQSVVKKIEKVNKDISFTLFLLKILYA